MVGSDETLTLHGEVHRGLGVGDVDDEDPVRERSRRREPGDVPPDDAGPQEDDLGALHGPAHALATEQLGQQVAGAARTVAPHEAPLIPPCPL